MGDGPYRSGDRSTRERRCLFCGGVVNDVSNTCTLCFVGAGPSLGVGAELTLTCPRCRTTMTPVHVARACVSQCDACHGCFVTPGDWSEIVSRFCAGDGGLGEFVPPPPGKELSAEQRLTPCACPMCNRVMDRVSFGARSRVVVDVCPEHGDWFDATELTACAQYTLAREERGGLPSQEEIAEDEESQRRRRADLDLEEVYRLKVGQFNYEHRLAQATGSATVLGILLGEGFHAK